MADRKQNKFIPGVNSLPQEKVALEFTLRKVKQSLNEVKKLYCVDSGHP